MKDQATSLRHLVDSSSRSRACSLPFIRSLRTAHRLLFSHLQSFVLYILLLPILIPGYTVWTIGFFAGLRHPLPDDDDGIWQSRSD